MRNEAEITSELDKITPIVKNPSSDVSLFVTPDPKNLRPLTADENERARGRAEGYCLALKWVLGKARTPGAA